MLKATVSLVFLLLACAGAASAQVPSKQQSNGSTRALKPSPLAAPVAVAVAMPRVSGSEPVDLSVPRLSAFSGRVWGGFVATVLLLGGAVAGSLYFAP